MARRFPRAAAAAALAASLVAGARLGSQAARAGVLEEVPVRGFGCWQVGDSVTITALCPMRAIPEREDPWLPVVELPDPASLPGCAELALVVDNVRITTCPGVPRPVGFTLGSDRATAEPLSIIAEPDYGGPGDILPFQICLDDGPWPSSVVIRPPDPEQHVIGAVVRTFCCEDCTAEP